MSLVGRAVWIARQFVRSAGLDDATVFVDTDSPEIVEEGRRWGATIPFLRPAYLALADTSTIDTVLHAVDRFEAAGPRVGTVVLLQPTSPLRSADAVLKCWRRFLEVGTSVVAVTPTAHPASQALSVSASGVVAWATDRSPELRRQDCPSSYWLAGSVYINDVEQLRSDRAFVVPGMTYGIEVSPIEALDVDVADDLVIADCVAGAGGSGSVRIGDSVIGSDMRCFVIAEVGVNHNGSVDMAHRLIDVAGDANVDAVKFQTFTPHLVASDQAPWAEYQLANTGTNESAKTMLARLELPRAAYPELQNHARERGLVFLSTPFDEGSADFLEELGVPAFKLPSGELTNHPLLAHAASKGLPLLVSTGMSRLEEVADALEVIAASGNPPVALFHCVSNYPANPIDCNLAAMATMRSVFGHPVGWSDHTQGTAISLAAVAMGAELLEKHFTLDRKLEGPDHRASLEPGELQELILRLREVEDALGDLHKRPASNEQPVAAVARRSLHAIQDLPPGHILTAADLVALRPAGGISPTRLRQVVGRPLVRAIGRGQILRDSDVE